MNTEEIRKQVGHRIKVRRVELQLEQRELGDLLGVPQSRVSDWERGRRAVRLDDAMALAKVLQTTVAYLAGEAPRV